MRARAEAAEAEVKVVVPVVIAPSLPLTPSLVSSWTGFLPVSFCPGEPIANHDPPPFFVVRYIIRAYLTAPPEVVIG